MNTVSIIAVCLSALAIVVTIIIAIINSGKSDRKESTESARELSEARTDIMNVKELCEDIRVDVKSMNTNFINLSREVTNISTESKVEIRNLKDRMDKFEAKLREAKVNG